MNDKEKLKVVVNKFKKIEEILEEIKEMDFSNDYSWETYLDAVQLQLKVKEHIENYEKELDNTK